MSGPNHTAAALLSARWTTADEPGVILADLSTERGAVGLAAIDPHRALDLSDADAAALANHVATVHNTSANVPQTEALTCPTKLLMRVGMLAGLIRHIRPGHPMTRDITDGLVSDANHILRELAVMGVEHPGVSDSEAQAMRTTQPQGSLPT